MSQDDNSPWGAGQQPGNDADHAGGGNAGGDGGGKPPADPAGKTPTPSPWLPDSDRSGGGGRPRRPGGLDNLLRKSAFSPHLPQLPDGAHIWRWAALAIAVLWVATTSVHVLQPTEQGVVTRLGSYARTVGSGVSFTLPAPIESMQVLATRSITAETIPANGGQNLMLTGDANIINLAYTVRWTIKSPARFAFQLEDPEQTIRDAAESAMRETVARFTLGEAIGEGQGDIATAARRRLQAILDAYASGVQIANVTITSSAAPQEVEAAFNAVSEARQQADSFQNVARADAQRSVQAARGAASEFDQIYAQYRLAPEVTRRRLYYETMEQILYRAPKTVVDSRGVTPYMALPDVRRATPAPAEPAPPAGAQP